MTDEPKRMGRPPIYGERQSMLIRLPVELVAKLDAWRESKGLTLTAAIQKIIERALKNR